MKIIKAFDKNNDGYITAEEMQQRMKELGKDVPLRSFELTVEQKDKNGDNKLDYGGKRKTCTNSTLFLC